MSANANAQEPVLDVKKNDAEINFRKQAEMYERKLEQERQARIAAEEKAARVEQIKLKNNTEDDDDVSDDPYVDHKVLTKKLAKFEKSFDEKIEKKATEKASQMLAQRDQEEYLNQNNDFNETMSPENLQKFVEKHPSLAKSLMRMPDGFERQKLVYENMKALNVKGKNDKKPDIQDKIDQNKRSGFYQPSGVGSAPYSVQSDYSEQGQKAAYDKVQGLKKRLGY